MGTFLIGAFATVNLITFLAFGMDKRRARRGKQRVPEATLLWLMFATGLLGGWFGMSFFRHKTRKRSFQLKMVLVTVFNPLWLYLYLRHWY